MSRRILVVEDEAPIREMLCFVLEQKGYQAVEAEDYDTAVEKLAEPFPILFYLIGCYLVVVALTLSNT